MAPKIGKMRFVVSLEKPKQLANGIGEIVLATDDKWEAVCNVHAAIKALTSEEIIRAKQVQLDTTHEITIRYRPDVKSDWRISLNTPDATTTFSIVGRTNPDLLNVWLVLKCVVTNGG